MIDDLNSKLKAESIEVTAQNVKNEELILKILKLNEELDQKNLEKVSLKKLTDAAIYEMNIVSEKFGDEKNNLT